MGDPVKIGRYTIDREERLGEGGFGTVFLGTDDRGRSIAGKQIYIKNKDEYDIERIYAEVEVHKKIPPHRNLIRYVDSITKGNHLWIFTEKCQEGDLIKYAKANDISERQKLIMMKELAEALRHLHSQDPPIVHRDVKPGNILIGDDGTVKLCDLGLAKITERHDGRTLTCRTHVGTDDYMAPELYLFKEDGRCHYSKKVDVFSAGVFFITFIESESRQDLRQFTLKGRPIGKAMGESGEYGGLTSSPIDFKLRDSPQVKQLKALAHTMTRRDPDKRPTMEEVLVELESILASMPEERSHAKTTRVIPEFDLTPKDVKGRATIPRKTLKKKGAMATAEVRPKDLKRPAANPKKTIKKAPLPDSHHDLGSLTIVGGCKALAPNYTESYACWREGRARSWKDITPLPQKLYGSSVSAIEDGLFLAGGGRDNQNATRVCYVYLAKSNDWQRRRDMPTARAGAAAVTAGECVYVLGGKRGGKIVNACEVYSGVLDEWMIMDGMLQGMVNPIAALSDDSQIFILYNDVSLNKPNQRGNEITLQVLNTETGEWYFGPSLPTHFGHTWGARAVGHNDTMLVAGGWSRIMAQYTPRTSTWLELSPPHLHHHFGAMVVHGGKVVIMGGQCKDGPGKVIVSDAIEEYNEEQNVWVVRKQKMPCALWSHHLVVINY